MRYAIFVDAGYVYAQGSVAIDGRTRRREYVALNLAALKEKLLETTAVSAPDKELLRIYWYDGVPSNRPTPAQQEVADMSDVKLRLGIVNEAGQQKGVDALILTDLIELSRNHAITDAFLLSGDEDLRVAVQLAQGFGVRVHLMGIEPSRGSQSRALIQEADTHIEWSKAEIEPLIEVRQTAGEADVRRSLAAPEQDAAILEEIVRDYVAGSSSSELEDIAQIPSNAPIPPEYDRILLGTCQNKLGRSLTAPERDRMRALLREMARATR